MSKPKWERGKGEPCYYLKDEHGVVYGEAEFYFDKEWASYVAPGSPDHRTRVYIASSSTLIQAKGAVNHWWKSVSERAKEVL